MSEAAQLAKTAREHLAAALNALQSNAHVPEALMDVAEPIAEAMSVLHRIERTQGANLEGRDAALQNVRTALNQLQAITAHHPAIDVVMEAVASSLSKVHALARYVPGPAAAAPPQAPRPAALQAPAAVPRAGPSFAPTEPAPRAMPAAPPRAAPQPAGPPAQMPMAQPMPAQPMQQPMAQPMQQPMAQPMQQPMAQPMQQPMAQPMQQPMAQPMGQPIQQMPMGHQMPQQPMGQPMGQPIQQMPMGAPMQQPSHGHALPPGGLGYTQAMQPGQVAAQPSRNAAQPAAFGPPGAFPQPFGQPAAPAGFPVHGTVPMAQHGATAPLPQSAQPAPQPAKSAPGGAPKVDVELGAHSPSNFYKGLGGNDVIEHGGIFVATYKIPKLGSAVTLRVLLPGDYEFQAAAVVQWAREGGAGETAEPGFGARFTQISPEARQLVYRYTRNREPIFYDDL